MTKVIFTYSWIYDQHWKSLHKGRSYPPGRRVEKFIPKAEKMWRKRERLILAEMSKVTGLKWRVREIPCYVVGYCIPFSDPLTVPISEKYPDWFVDTLTHELIHQIFMQPGNLRQAKKAWSHVYRKYRNENEVTKIHIPVHALHSHIYMKFFDSGHIRRDVFLMEDLPDYRRSWAIVQKEGYQKILSEFTTRIKK